MKPALRWIASVLLLGSVGFYAVFLRIVGVL